MKVINLFGGPGTGKSTIAAGLFTKMKMKHMNVELVTEYAKSLTYDSRFNIIESDQLYILAKQNRKLERLKPCVDIAITDSPLLLCGIYFNPDKNTCNENTFMKLLHEMHNSYDNMNIFLERNSENPYQETGRTQTIAQSFEIDRRIKNSLKDIDYISVKSDIDAIDKIFEMINSE